MNDTLSATIEAIQSWPSGWVLPPAPKKTPIHTDAFKALANELVSLRERVNSLNSLAFEEWYGRWQDGRFVIFESSGEGVASGETVTDALRAFEAIN